MSYHNVLNLPADKMAITLDLQDKDEFFTHQDDDGTMRHFPAAAMYRLAEKIRGTTPMIKCVKVRITQTQVDFIRKNMGIEQERLNRLCEPYLSRPGVAIEWGGDRGNSITYIDGNHRIVKLWDMNIKEIKTYIFERDLWEQCTVNFRPEFKKDHDFLNAPSKMIEHEQEKMRDQK